MVFKTFFYFITVSVLGYILVSCQPETKNNNNTVTEANKTQEVHKSHIVPPDFNADSAYVFVKAQADMGPRTPGSKAHQIAIDYYKKQFEKYGAEVKIQSAIVQTYDNKEWNLQNVIAIINPKAENRILLCSHYDSRPFADKDKNPENHAKPCPGVNDGASGVGVLMEIARQLQLKSTDVGVDIILFDLEDYGNNHGDPESWCLGSQYWSKNLHVPYYSAKYGILLDMVGAKNAYFPKEGLSVFYANEALNKIWNAGQHLGYGQYFSNEECGEMTDDHAFINKLAQIPCVDILHYLPQQNEFFEHHHTTTDDMNQIDKNTLKAVGQTLLEVIYNE